MLKKITKTNSLIFMIAYDIYVKSFKPHQRRTLSDLIDKIRKNRCDFFALEASNQIIGILISWMFEKFNYIEQFAIREELRGKNYGQQALSEYLNEVKNPVVLEIDCSDDTEPVKKRIKFYEKMQFFMHSFPYLEPSYDSKKIFVPARIMSYPHLFEDQQLMEVKETLYDFVYEVTKDPRAPDAFAVANYG
jgi:ribosomal protein S18 acetylase RimI-like enzyme